MLVVRGIVAIVLIVVAGMCIVVVVVVDIVDLMVVDAAGLVVVVVFVVGLADILLVVDRVLEVLIVIFLVEFKVWVLVVAGSLGEDVVVTVSVELCCLQGGESWQGPLESVFPSSSTAVAHQGLPRW